MNTAVPLTVRGMDWKHLAETVSRMDADAEPPRMGQVNINMGRVSARYFRFMSVVSNGYNHIYWHRDMNSVFSPKTRPILIKPGPSMGGSNPASMRDTVFGDNTQSMSLILVVRQ